MRPNHSHGKCHASAACKRLLAEVPFRKIFSSPNWKMVKMYSGHGGRSRSMKPYGTIPTWANVDLDEIKVEIVQMANKGISASLIGMRLRDIYGIGCAKDALGDTITVFLQKNGVLSEIPYDLECIVRKVNSIKIHLNLYPKDNSAKYRLMINSSKLYRIIRYYKRTLRIPGNWKPKLVENKR
jgi:small subunit ribosomal protein S13e